MNIDTIHIDSSFHWFLKGDGLLKFQKLGFKTDTIWNILSFPLIRSKVHFYFIVRLLNLGPLPRTTEKNTPVCFYDMSSKAKKIYKLTFLCNLSKFEVRQHGEDGEDKVGSLSGLCRVLNFTKELFPLIPEGTSCLIFFPSVASLSKNRRL